MDERELARQMEKVAHITGHFVLRSGQVSTEYFDKYRLEADPLLLRRIAAEMKALVPGDAEILAGLELGGVPLATALSLETGLPAAFVRKRAKEYGTCKLAEGAEAMGRKVCVIEDVVTTGGQIIESVKELRARGAVVDTVLCMILLGNQAVSLLAAEGLLLKPLFTMEQLRAASQG